MSKDGCTPSEVLGSAGPLHGTVSLVAYDLPPNLTYEEWASEGNVLVTMARASMFWLGDWIRYGEHHFGEKYSQAIESTGYDVQTLRNAVWVADRIPPSQRRSALSFSIHRAVAVLEPKDRKKVLDKAEAEGLSEYEVRSEVKHLRAETGDPPKKVEVVDPPSDPIATAIQLLLDAVEALDWDLVIEARELLEQTVVRA